MDESQWASGNGSVTVRVAIDARDNGKLDPTSGAIGLRRSRGASDPIPWTGAGLTLSTPSTGTIAKDFTFDGSTGDGTFWARFRARDLAANTNESRDYAVNVDLFSPWIEWCRPTGGALIDGRYTKENSTDVELPSSFDSASGVSHQRSGTDLGSAGWSWPFIGYRNVYFVPSDGEHPLWVQVKDAVGFESARCNMTVVRDTRAPLVTSAAPEPGRVGWSPAGGIRIEWAEDMSASTDVVGLSTAVDGIRVYLIDEGTGLRADITPVSTIETTRDTGKLQYSGALRPDTPYKVEIRMKDRLGNAGYQEYRFTTGLI